MSAQTNDVVQVPLVAFESALEREDRKHKRAFILNIVLVIYAFLMTALFVASNYWWIEYEKQFEDIVTTTTTQTITQDSEGGSNTYNGDFIGGDYYGETDSDE